MRVAIAGYGDLAWYICDEFVQASHELVVLTRSHKPQLDGRPGVTQAVTDYTPASLRAPLATAEVLVSTISDTSPAYTAVHVALVQACLESPACKRFVPAEFAADIEAHPDQPGFYYAPHEPVRELLRTRAAGLEWTLVCVGWLADYFVPAANRRIRDIGALHSVDWAGRRIAIPGTGNEPVDFTWARDVARALAALVEAPRGAWEPYTFVSGERSCWNDAVELARRTCRLDFPTARVSLHAVSEMIETGRDEDTLVLADYYMLSISQACASPADKVRSHREKFFPNVGFRTLRDGLCQLDEYPDSIL
ncbi:hypothetical protein Hte_003119 [Hypoxylon texense]